MLDSHLVSTMFGFLTIHHQLIVCLCDDSALSVCPPASHYGLQQGQVICLR